MPRFCILMFFFLLQKKALGEDLFSQVVKHLHLLEADYFGLEFESKERTPVSPKPTPSPKFLQTYLSNLRYISRYLQYF